MHSRGAHISSQVCDVSCVRCSNPVGWTYLHAFEPSQKYKESRFIRKFGAASDQPTISRRCAVEKAKTVRQALV